MDNNNKDQDSLSISDSTSTPIHDPLLYMLAELPSQSDSYVDRFYSEPCTKFEENSTIEWALHWWNRQKAFYPTMDLVARDFLSIPAASVSIQFRERYNAY